MSTMQTLSVQITVKERKVVKTVLDESNNAIEIVVMTPDEAAMTPLTELGFDTVAEVAVNVSVGGWVLYKRKSSPSKRICATSACEFQ
jgi:ethanolamine utilization microcompartment shell protein EutS